MPGLKSDQHCGHSGFSTMVIRVLPEDPRMLQIHYRVHVALPLIHLMQLYAQETRIPLHLLNFKFGGVSLKADDTPISLRMYTGEVVYVTRVTA